MAAAIVNLYPSDLGLLLPGGSGFLKPRSDVHCLAEVPSEMAVLDHFPRPEGMNQLVDRHGLSPRPHDAYPWLQIDSCMVKNFSSRNTKNPFSLASCTRCSLISSESSLAIGRLPLPLLARLPRSSDPVRGP